MNTQGQTTPSAPFVTSIRLGRYPSTIGIGDRRPAISWRFNQDQFTEAAWLQTRYELKIVRGSGTGTVYDQVSDRNVDVPWPSLETDLQSRERIEIAIRVKGQAGWSGLHSRVFTTGLFDERDWTSTFISGERQIVEDGPQRPLYLRNRFSLSEEDIQGSLPVLYATSAGVYELQLNGQYVSEDVLTPGWQPYQHRLDYQVYEIPRRLLRVGINVLGAKIGEGWFAGKIGGKRNNWGSRLGLRLQMEFSSGRRIETRADDWEWAYGPIISSELYDGEVFKVDLDSKEWSTSCPDTWLWRPAETINPKVGQLVASEVPPNRRIRVFEPEDNITTPSGKRVLDFGQNMSGRVLIRRLPAATETCRVLTLQFAEIMDKGEIDTRSNRNAKARDTIYLGAQAMTDWEPTFTMHGFRYVQIEGDPSGLFDAGNIRAVAIHADMEPLGTFECSHSKINKLYHCVEWGVRGNFLSVATDCPQRDERMGWTGDLTVFAPTASFLFDTRGFFASWLQGLAVEQLKDRHGVPPVESPDTWGLGMGLFPQSIWVSPLYTGIDVLCDVVALAPFDLYQLYGETPVLREMYESMSTWLSRGIPRDADNMWMEDDESYQFGDWCDPRSPPDDGGAAMTEPYLVANAYLARTTWTVGQIAQILGMKADADRYATAHLDLRAKFRERYITPSGRVLSDSQSAYALCLAFGLLEPSEETLAVKRLRRLVMRGQYRINTGFAGTPFILQVLADRGCTAFAYRMLQEKNSPSWMNMVNCGATTMWERWDSMTPAGPMPTSRAFMPSFNHFAYGSVATFLVNTVAGISPAAPGWKVVNIWPRPGGTVRSAKASHISPYGPVSVSWQIKDAIMSVDSIVPPNTTAKVVLGGKSFEVGSGFHHWEIPYAADVEWPPKLVPPSVGASLPEDSYEP